MPGATPLGDPRLAQRLRREVDGDVLFTRADRGRYSPDASIYEVEPVGARRPAIELVSRMWPRLSFSAGIAARVV